jgi:hypothetical protein
MLDGLNLSSSAWTIENVHFLGIERVLEAGGDIRNFGEVDRKQEDVGNVDLPSSPQYVRARDDETAFAHFLAVHEGSGITGDEDEDFSRVAEAIVADGAPGDQVRRDMVKEDQP